METDSKIMIIDFTNYEDYPIGGYLSFARSLIDTFGTGLALVGITTSKTDPVGKWFKKEINLNIYDFFAIARYGKSRTRHLIPDRLVSFLLIKIFRRRIFKINIDNIFLQRQEILLAVPELRSRNVCYCFAGLENPLAISKYSYATYISRWFERIFFRRLRLVKTILAAGDTRAINEMVKRSNGIISESRVIKFPTRINTEIFRPVDRIKSRKTLDLAENSTIIVTTGRIAPLKGWKFMVDCFIQFKKVRTNSILYFIGEGEDEEELKHYIYNSKLSGDIVTAGRKSQLEVALFLNASDLFIMGSYKEGWSTSLIEAIACGVPACVTDFSSAEEIIEEGQNGFVVPGHDTDSFVYNMVKALALPRPVKNDKIVMLSSDRLGSDLLKYWELK